MSPVCLIPMAMPRRRGGNHSTIALAVAGFSTLKPKPLATRHARIAPKLGLRAARTIIAPVSA